MEYTPMEKDVLAMMQRTDFKNISKGDVISFASKIGELRPEVAKEVLAQFPEFIGLIKSSLTEYKGMLDTIVSSDDASIKEYYGVANKEMDQAADSRKQFYAFVKQVQADCSKLLGGISFTLMTVAGISAGVLGGKFDLKFPKKS